MESIPFRYGDSYLLEFQTLREFVEYIELRLRETDLLKLRFKFVADVVKVKPYNGSLYITVSQETVDGKKTELTIILWKNLTKIVLNSLGLKSEYELEHKKWEFQGKLSFYPDRAQFSFWADSIAPQGESDILQRRQKIKELLKKERLLMEVLHNLDELEPIKYIAVITSKTAQGYFDFLSNILVPDELRPVIHLYESSMQGATTAEEVISALNRIETFCREFMVKYDVIVIIRGGGGPSDLMYFDDYNLARRIAQMNNFIPVLTGIGHEKDETIPDFVAWRRFPTPTAVAKEISNQIKGYQDKVERSVSDLSRYMENAIELLNAKLSDTNYKTVKEIFRGKIQSVEEELIDSAEVLYKRFSLKEYEKMISMDFIKNLSEKMKYNISEFSKKLMLDYKYLKDTLELKINNINQQVERYIKLSDTLEKQYSNLSNLVEEKKEEFVKIGGPLSALSFGGAVVLKDRKIIQSKKELSIGENVIINFIDGKVQATISGND
ncbi:exodeoxyribonuclease VII large subunit [Fervidobacterium sp. 2310opik-2]|uniref:exodeoxyribonuclease VII large subunit n=1 Tax=Fervidobacterium sp. 2310opik-2 TaxID=1755815 RepID=UPI0013E03402|nr:exodeoxyribonuclease VII large subunit [Fervidobacterium sp. 2310opik-2]KAF2962204.1 exodeoxyribonuclease VII [Fervidobacterium sp. 2310opik-2]